MMSDEFWWFLTPHPSLSSYFYLLKFIFSKKATTIDEIFTVDLTLCRMCQIDGEDFAIFYGLLRKYELYHTYVLSLIRPTWLIHWTFLPSKWNTIVGLKMMEKSGLENIIYKSLQAGKWLHILSHYWICDFEHFYDVRKIMSHMKEFQNKFSRPLFTKAITK